MSILAASVTACPDPSGTQVVLYGQKPIKLQTIHSKSGKTDKNQFP
jgi:hypothetical protein